MAYTTESNLQNPTHQLERELLAAGFNYSEVAARTGSKIKSISERNRLVYNTDLQTAFRGRVERDGIPSRLNISDAFGYWFSGYFDGEGCLTVMYRERNGVAERRVGIQLACRNDDAQILSEIKQTIGAGVAWLSKGKEGTNTSEAANWRVELIADLAEIVIPLFDKYPLKSKKRLEYTFWRTLVIEKYIQTLGGKSSRVGATAEENAAFQLGQQNIREIRHRRTSGLAVSE